MADGFKIRDVSSSQFSEAVILDSYSKVIARESG